jgi:hypothetical protein
MPVFAPITKTLRAVARHARDTTAIRTGGGETPKGELHRFIVPVTGPHRTHHQHIAGLFFSNRGCHVNAMKTRIAVLLSLLVIGGLLSSIQPAQAGAWVAKVHLSCTAKQSPAGQQRLFFPAAGPATTVATTYAVSCGKGKPVKHFTTPAGIQEFCQLDQLAPNGKKATKTKPLPNPLPPTMKSNCNIKADAIVNAGSSCGNSTGSVTGSITNKDGKVVTFDAAWTQSIAGNLILTGTTSKMGIFRADVQTSADSQKGRSCATGTDAFKVVGTATAEGTKAK